MNRSMRLYQIVIWIGMAIAVNVAVTVWLLEKHLDIGHAVPYLTRAEYLDFQRRTEHVQHELRQDIRRLYRSTPPPGP